MGGVLSLGSLVVREEEGEGATGNVSGIVNRRGCGLPPGGMESDSWDDSDAQLPLVERGDLRKVDRIVKSTARSRAAQLEKNKLLRAAREREIEKERGSPSADDEEEESSEESSRVLPWQPRGPGDPTWAEEKEAESAEEAAAAATLLRIETSGISSASEGEDDDSGKAVCLLPTARVRVRAMHGDEFTELFCLLDSGASRSFITEAAVDRVNGEKCSDGGNLKVHGIGGSLTASDTCHVVMKPRAGLLRTGKEVWVRSLHMRVLPSLGKMLENPLTQEDLRTTAAQLGDILPRIEEDTELDIILGQDVLWDLYTDKPRKEEEEGMHLMVYPSRLGLVVGGVMEGAGVKKDDISLVLQTEPTFHTLHPALRKRPKEDGEEYLMLSVEQGVEDHAAEFLREMAALERRYARKLAGTGIRPEDLVNVGRKLEAFMRYEGLGIEPPGQGGSSELTPMEVHALESIRDSLSFEKGKYTVGLTFAPDHPKLTNNRFHAAKRLEQVERSFKRIAGLEEKYEAAIQEFLVNGDIEKVEEEGPAGRTFYLPHKAVLREDKATSKTRIVFDGSAKDGEGVSLNDCLLKGPAGKQDLLKILVNFRWEQVAFSGDVRRMFLCIGVQERDRDHLRFLWREKKSGELVTYRFRNVTFGLRDAPFVAQEVFKIHAEKYKDRYPEAVDVLINKRWVDDLLTSVRSPQRAADVIRQICDIMAEGGFPVKKWVSSSTAVMESIPQDDRLDLGVPLRLAGAEGDGVTLDEAKVSALGVCWFVAQDLFKIAGAEQEQVAPDAKVTKRLITSKVSAIFDPLGLVGPYTMGGKRLIQRIWEKEREEVKRQGWKGNELMKAQKQSWDRRVAEEICKDFRAWHGQINLLVKFELPRSLVLKDKTVKERQLHVFGDASPFGCAAAAYCRVVYGDNTRSTLLLNSKSRVAPAEDSAVGGRTNLPRLELTASVMAQRLAVTALEDHPSTEVIFWTDSSVAHQWIRTGFLDKKVWVANRVREILQNSRKEQWRHVPGVENPADLGTRGIPCQELLDSLVWKFGPDWLDKAPALWPERTFTLEEEDQQLYKDEVTAFGSKESRETLLMVMMLPENHQRRFWKPHGPPSPLGRIREAVNCQERLEGVTILFMDKEKGMGLPHRSADSMRRALGKHIKDVQWFWYAFEIEALEAGEEVDARSPLAKVRPALDKEGYVRARGRFPGGKSRAVPPIILPASDRLTELIVTDLHQRSAHAGVGYVKYRYFEEFWSSNVERVIRRIIGRCVLCQRLHKCTLTQGVGDLPPWRNETEPRPFSYVGVDYAGPIVCYKATHTTDRRRKLQHKEKDRKLYVLLFTCMQIRAVHFEVVDSQAVEPLNLAVRRFMARKGKPKSFYSDNAKSFRKAAKEIEVLQEFHTATGVRMSLQAEGIKWHFMPDRAPWWGGLHERMVKTMKAVLRITLQGCYSEDEIRTFVAEAEALVNSRPLARVKEDPGEQLPITPSQILMGYNITSAPFPEVPTTGSEKDIVKKLWARRQHLLQIGRRRFIKDYVQDLRAHRKGQEYIDEPLKVGDLVVYEEGSGKRTDWPLGRVTQLFPGRDGKVRSVGLQTRSGQTTRALQKIVALELGDLGESKAVEHDAEGEKIQAGESSEESAAEEAAAEQQTAAAEEARVEPDGQGQQDQ